MLALKVPLRRRPRRSAQVLTVCDVFYCAFFTNSLLSGARARYLSMTLNMPYYRDKTVAMNARVFLSDVERFARAQSSTSTSSSQKHTGADRL